MSDPDCLGAIYGAEEPVYAGSGWTAVVDQVARENTGRTTTTGSSRPSVLYPSADKAQKFFDESKSAWQECANYSVSVDDGGTLVHVADRQRHVRGHDDHPVTTQEDANGWACQHALSPVSNVTVEAWACSYDVKDEAATIANGMVANAAKK